MEKYKRVLNQRLVARLLAKIKIAILQPA
jgi:hypothetical protein